MKIEGDARRVRVYIGESDHWHGKPLYTAIVERCRREGLAGATVLRGIEGYGANSRIHTARILRLSEDLPIVVDIVDRPERIDTLLPILDEMVTEGLITVETVHVLKYVHGAAPPSPPPAAM
jgi:PII-like signaling protein